MPFKTTLLQTESWYVWTRRIPFIGAGRVKVRAISGVTVTATSAECIYLWRALACLRDSHGRRSLADPAVVALLEAFAEAIHGRPRGSGWQSGGARHSMFFSTMEPADLAAMYADRG